MQYPLDALQNIVNGTLLQAKSADNPLITSVLFDSRLFKAAQGVLFIALTSPKNDGHHFIKELYDKGVRHFLIEKNITTTDYKEANFIFVPNTLVAFQQLARYHRTAFQLPVIGITGSNGKTIIKEWLYQLLHPFYNIVKSPQSYNSQIGVPYSVLLLLQRHDLAIFEAGISTSGEMQHLAPIIDCNIGIFSNIGDAHNEGFESLSQKVDEKLLLFKNTPTIIYCKNHRLIDEQIKATYPNKNLLTWGYDDDCILKIKNIAKSDTHTTITAFFKNKNTQITIPFTDDASIENCCHIWLCCLHLGKEIDQRLQLLTPVALRLEVKSGIRNCLIINDTYNADVSSLQVALSFMTQQSKHDRKTLILSDILQSGLPPTLLYQQISELIIQNNINQFIGIGTHITALADLLPDTIKQSYYRYTTDFIKKIPSYHFQNETILIKGARAFTFEKISTYLSRKNHKAVLEIDLNALIHNVKVYKSLLKPSTKLMVMVKASAYGSGSSETAKLLEANGIDYFAVAYTDEAVELRQQGIKTPILVLNPEEDSFHSLVEYQIEPEIYSIQQLKNFISLLSQFPSISAFPIHIKLDTGMHRLGFEQQDIALLLELLQQNTAIKVASIFSHLAASDNPKHDEFTHHQLELFNHLAQQITHTIGYQPILHILNSSGIIRFSEYQLDMVRLGIGLYGIDSAAQIQAQLQPVSQLKATISQIKTIAADDTVGYDRSGVLHKNTRIATINIGYADGFSRGFSKGKGGVWLHGQLVPVVGNVCMDMTMIDITDIPPAQEGDEVIIFGKKLPIQTLAATLNTIPYEILTGISDRVHRVYFKE